MVFTSPAIVMSPLPGLHACMHARTGLHKIIADIHFKSFSEIHGISFIGKMIVLKLQEQHLQCFNLAMCVGLSGHYRMLSNMNRQTKLTNK